MKGPTDEQIFNYMLPHEHDNDCYKCGSDDVTEVNYSYYTTYKCNNCGDEPEPPEEY